MVQRACMIALISGIWSYPTLTAAFLPCPLPLNCRGCSFPSSHENPRPNTQFDLSRGFSAATQPLHLFGGIFGSDSSGDGDELARISKVATSDRKHDSLSEYIRLWSEMFEDPKKSGLTTPVKVFPSDGVPDEEGVVSVSGVRLVFQATKTGNAYKSKDEEKASKQDDEFGASDSSEVDEAKKEGGVEILVEKLNDGEVRVRARRCDLDEDTMIKEMSEENIINKLKEAINVWKKEQK